MYLLYGIYCIIIVYCVLFYVHDIHWMIAVCVIRFIVIMCGLKEFLFIYSCNLFLTLFALRLPHT